MCGDEWLGGLGRDTRCNTEDEQRDTADVAAQFCRPDREAGGTRRD